MFDNVINGIFSAAFLAAILRVMTPILLPSMGALISEKAGVINIGLEGMMLSSAFTGVVVSAYAQDWFGSEAGLAAAWLGLVCGVTVSVLLSLVLAFFHLNLKGDLILSAIALNVLGSSATVAIMFELTGDRGNTSTLASLQMPFIQLPEFINQIPIIGAFIFGISSDPIRMPSASKKPKIDDATMVPMGVPPPSAGVTSAIKPRPAVISRWNRLR